MTASVEPGYCVIVSPGSASQKFYGPFSQADAEAYAKKQKASTVITTVSRAVPFVLLTPPPTNG